MKGATFSGTLVSHGEETAVLTYVLDDERRRAFLLAYPAGFITIEPAKKLNGKPYVTGMYLTDDAKLILGKDKLLKIYDFKKEVDPDGILNPGKVFPTSLDKDSPIKKLKPND